MNGIAVEIEFAIEIDTALNSLGSSHIYEVYFIFNFDDHFNFNSISISAPTFA